MTICLRMNCRIECEFSSYFLMQTLPKSWSKLGVSVWNNYWKNPMLSHNILDIHLSVLLQNVSLLDFKEVGRLGQSVHSYPNWVESCNVFFQSRLHKKKFSKKLWSHLCVHSNFQHFLIQLSIQFQTHNALTSFLKS